MSGWRDWPEIWSCSWTGPYGMLWVVNLLLYLFPLLSFHGPHSHSVLPHVSLAADQRCGQKLCIQTCMTCDVIMEMNLEWKSGFFLRNFKGLIRFIMTRHVEALQRDQFPASSPHCVPSMQPFFPLSLSLLHSVYLYFYVQGDAAGAKGIQFWRSFNSDSGGRIAQRRNITLLPWLLCTFTSCLEHPASRFFPVESALRFQSPYGTHHGSWWGSCLRPGIACLSNRFTSWLHSFLSCTPNLMFPLATMFERWGQATKVGCVQ